MPNARPYPTTDAELIEQIRDDNEQAIRDLGVRITVLESKLGEAKDELASRKLTRVSFSRLLDELEARE